jgi:uncharacterized membrane protein
MGRSGGVGGGFSGGGFSGGGFSGGGRSSGGFSGSSHSSGGRSLGGGSSYSGGGSFSSGFGGSPFFSGRSTQSRPSSSTVVPILINAMRNSGGNQQYGMPSGNWPSPSVPMNPSTPRNSSQKSGCGCSTILIVIIIIIILGVIITIAAGSGNSSIINSTVKREKLPVSAVHETGYYTDADGDWIHRPSKLTSGMRSFYRETGVQPYLYILPNGSNTSINELTLLANKLYSDLFTDNAHFLLVFCDDGRGSYNCGYIVGAQAKTIMDDEAIEILTDYLDRYYNDYTLSEEEIFSKTFEDTGKRIMTVQKSPLVPVVVCITLIIITVVVYFILKARREQRAKEQKRIEEIIRTPLEKFGDKEVENLARKYEENIPNNNR